MVAGGVCSAQLPAGADRALPRSRPSRVNMADMVAVVRALGAGCLGSAAMFQRGAAPPDEVQPRHVIPYQFCTLGRFLFLIMLTNAVVVFVINKWKNHKLLLCIVLSCRETFTMSPVVHRLFFQSLTGRWLIHLCNSTNYCS